MAKDPEVKVALPYTLSLIAGFGICVAVSLVSGRREAWDSSLYFVAGIPLMCAAAFALAYKYPVKAWRWPAAMAVGQSFALVIGGGSLTLWPLALIMMLIVSVPQFVAAIVASRIARGRAAPRS